MQLPSDILYGKVTWAAMSAVADSRNDPDSFPEGVPVTGFVTFAPSVPELQIFSATPTSVFATTVTYAIGADGVLRDELGAEGIYLLATNAPGVTPTGWKWTVSYKLNNGLSRGSFSFDLPAGGTVNLTEVRPVTATNGVPIIRGPKGDKGDSGLSWPVVINGDDANVARPNTTSPVIWFGSVDPVNSDDAQDVWIPLSGTGGTLTALDIESLLPTRLSDASLKAALVPGSVYANDRTTVLTTKRLHVVLTADGNDIDDLVIETVH